MAKLDGYPSPYVLMLLFLFLLVSTEMRRVEAKICQRRSKTWSGICANSNNCDRQCKNWEGDKNAACHRQYLRFACFCYFNC